MCCMPLPNRTNLSVAWVQESSSVTDQHNVFSEVAAPRTVSIERHGHLSGHDVLDSVDDFLSLAFTAVVRHLD